MKMSRPGMSVLFSKSAIFDHVMAPPIQYSHSTFSG